MTGFKYVLKNLSGEIIKSSPGEYSRVDSAMIAGTENMHIHNMSVHIDDKFTSNYATSVDVQSTDNEGVWMLVSQ